MSIMRYSNNLRLLRLHGNDTVPVQTKHLLRWPRSWERRVPLFLCATSLTPPEEAMLSVRRYVSVRASFSVTFYASLFACLFALTVNAWAKEPSLTAIELYPGTSGPAYAQLANVTINGKTEVRLCGGSGPIDKNSYGKLQKVSLAVGMSLERDSHGVLLLTRGQDTSCAVPDNLNSIRTALFLPPILRTEPTSRARPLQALTEHPASCRR